MSALSAISECRTEIDWAQGRKSASRGAGNVVLWVVTPEGWGSVHFRLKRLSRIEQQACNASRDGDGGSGIQGDLQLLSHSEAGLSSYHGNFIDGGKWEVRNLNLRAPCMIPLNQSSHFRSKEKVRRQGLGSSVKTCSSAMQRDASGHAC